MSGKVGKVKKCRLAPVGRTEKDCYSRTLPPLWCTPFSTTHGSQAQATCVRPFKVRQGGLKFKLLYRPRLGNSHLLKGGCNPGYNWPQDLGSIKLKDLARLLKDSHQKMVFCVSVTVSVFDVFWQRQKSVERWLKDAWKMVEGHIMILKGRCSSLNRQNTMFVLRLGR